VESNKVIGNKIAELEAAAILVAMMEAAGIDPSDFIENVAGPAELRWLAAADAAFNAFEASLSRNDDLAVTDALHDDLIRADAAYDAARAADDRADAK
jgi:hypothetical protein